MTSAKSKPAGVRPTAPEPRGVRMITKRSARQVGSFEIDLVLRGLPVVLLRRGHPVAAIVRLPIEATKTEGGLSQFIDALRDMTGGEGE